MPKDFTEIDAAILARIQQAPCTFTQVQSQQIIEMARAHVGEPFRVVDRRLQALRKQGLIQFGKGRWSCAAAAEANVEPGAGGGGR